MRKKDLRLSRVIFERGEYDKEKRLERLKAIKDNEIKIFKNGDMLKPDNIGGVIFVKEKDAEKIKQALKNSQEVWIENDVKNIVGLDSIKDLELGDKVEVEIESMVGMIEQKGTVERLDKEKGQATIRKYRSQSKGWIVSAGEEGYIKKGWS